jgi:YVTN family beta-propeller protein
MKVKSTITICAMNIVFSAAMIAQTHSYHVARTIPIPGNGAWDYIVYDAPSHRLFIPHGTQVEVLDPATGKSLGAIQNTPGVHGIAVLPGSKRALITNGHADTVSLVDLDTFQHIAEIPAGKDPDSILYEPFTGRIFVSNGESNDITVIDPIEGHVLATIAAGGAPEYSASDSRGRMWVNLEDRNAVAEIDPKAMRIVRTIPVPGCSQPTSMAFDANARRLFLGCRNRVLAVVDPDHTRTIAKLPIGLHVDGTVYDPTQHFIFVSSGDGLLTIIRQISPDHYVREAKIVTLRGAKTIALDASSGTLYLPTMKDVPANSFGPPRASGPMAYTPSPFEVLVVSREQ